MRPEEYYKKTRLVETNKWTLFMAMRFAEEYCEAESKALSIQRVSQCNELLSDLINFSNENAPDVISKGLKQVILEFKESLNCG